MSKESKIYNFIDKYSWIFLYFILFCAFFISFAWFMRDKDYEPAFALTGSLLAFIIFLFSKGIKGLNLGIGMILGISITTILFYFITLSDSKEIKAQLEQAKREKSILKEENENLQRKVIELIISPPCNIDEAARKRLLEQDVRNDELIFEKQVDKVMKAEIGLYSWYFSLDFKDISNAIIIFFFLIVIIGALMGKVSWGMAIITNAITIIIYILFYTFQY
jgi:cell division protein FtsB